MSALKEPSISRRVDFGPMKSSSIANMYSIRAVEVSELINLKPYFRGKFEEI